MSNEDKMPEGLCIVVCIKMCLDVSFLIMHFAEMSAMLPGHTTNNIICLIQAECACTDPGTASIFEKQSLKTNEAQSDVVEGAATVCS